ncbi:MAG: hypothetical protein AB7O37_04885 [Vicinamibacteria bacterium]
MIAAGARRHAGLLAASLVAVAAVAWQEQRPRPGYSETELPGFDAYVYVAMADNPAVFTVAPWGYRTLVPELVHTRPPRHRLLAFRYVARAGLVLAGALLFLFLRRLGHAPLVALGGVAAFDLSRPVLELLRMPVLTDPLAVALFVAALLAVESRASLLATSVLLGLGLLCKELFVLLLPLVFLARRRRRGVRGACLDMLLVALPGLVVQLALRLWWTSGLRIPRAPLPELLAAALPALAAELPDVSQRLLLEGLLPLALLGALLPRGRSFFARYGYLALAALAVPLLAWVNAPSATAAPHVGANLPRLLVYALPLLIPPALGLLAAVFERGLRRAGWAAAAGVFAMTDVADVNVDVNVNVNVNGDGDRGAQARPRLGIGDGAALVALSVLIAYPFARLDRYRRLALHDTRDGPLVATFCRESVRGARLLERGEPVVLDMAERSFEWGVSDPREAWRMRWFLREGWGPSPQYGTGEVRMQAQEASFVLPVLERRPLDVVLTLEAAEPVRLELRLHGRSLGPLTAAPGAAPTRVRIGADALVRGDNLLRLVAADPTPGVRLLRLAFEPAP